MSLETKFFFELRSYNLELYNIYYILYSIYSSRTSIEVLTIILLKSLRRIVKDNCSFLFNFLNNSSFFVVANTVLRTHNLEKGHFSIIQFFKSKDFSLAIYSHRNQLDS